MQYAKPALDVSQQLDQLRQRGLNIKDVAYARKVLLNVGYYRLSGYWWPLQADTATHSFAQGASFNQAVALYKFDRELRQLCFHMLERIEVAVRTKMIFSSATHWCALLHLGFP